MVEGRGILNVAASKLCLHFFSPVFHQEGDLAQIQDWSEWSNLVEL